MANAIPDWHQKAHAEFTSLGRKAGLCGAGGALLVALGAIAIFSSSLVLTLPGVNAMTQVVLPGMLPGGAGMAASIPIFYLAYRFGVLKRAVHADWIPQIKNFMQDCKPEAPADLPENKDPVKEHAKLWAEAFARPLFTQPWSIECKKKILTDLMKEYKEKESLESKMLTEALKIAMDRTGKLSKSEED